MYILFWIQKLSIRPKFFIYRSRVGVEFVPIYHWTYLLMLDVEIEIVVVVCEIEHVKWIESSTQTVKFSVGINRIMVWMPSSTKTVKIKASFKNKNVFNVIINGVIKYFEKAYHLKLK